MGRSRILNRQIPSHWLHSAVQFWDPGSTQRLHLGICGADAERVRSNFGANTEEQLRSQQRGATSELTERSNFGANRGAASELAEGEHLLAPQTSGYTFPVLEAPFVTKHNPLVRHPQGGRVGERGEGEGGHNRLNKVKKCPNSIQMERRAGLQPAPSMLTT